METIFGFIFLMSGLFMLSSRRVKNAIALLSLQSVALSMIVLKRGIVNPLEWQTLIMGLLILLIKGGFLPIILFRQVSRLKLDEQIQVGWGSVVSMIIGVFFVGLTYGYIVPILLQEVNVSYDLLAAAIASILFGCLIVVSRGCVVNQVLGVIVMENGIFLCALALTGGMSLMIELGILFDVLIGVLVMGAIVYKISDRFHSLDSHDLNRLRG